MHSADSQQGEVLRWEPRDIRAHLLELSRLEFLYERTGGAEPVYVFKHALTQDVAQATLVVSRRRELHRRAAEALQALDPARGQELAPVLAYQYYEAEAWAPAALHARRAAEAARRAHANREAVARFDQALIAAERAELDPAERIGLRESRASVLTSLGDFERARADLEAALGLAESLGDAAVQGRVLWTLGALWGGHKDYQRGLDLTRRAVTVIEASGHRGALAEARAQLGITCGSACPCRSPAWPARVAGSRRYGLRFHVRDRRRQAAEKPCGDSRKALANVLAKAW